MKINKNVLSSVSAGSLGSLSGGLLSLVLPGGGGIVAGAAATGLVSGIFSLLSEKEIDRSEAVKKKINLLLDKKIKDGFKIRSDFIQDGDGNKKAEEITEELFRIVQKSSEEKKIDYFANIFVNVAINPDITLDHARLVINLANKMTYRQYCLLRIFSTKNQYGLRSTDYRDVGNFPKDLYQVLYECYYLHNDGLIAMDNDTMLGVTDVNPSKIHIQGLGADCYNLMELYNIPESDVEQIIMLLR